MKILIAGSNQFIITHIIDKYIKEDYKVVRICEEVTEEIREKKEVKVYYKSLLENDIKSIFKANRFDEVLYIPSDDEISESFKLKNLLELAVKNKAKKFTYLSSQEVYGDLLSDINEESSKNPKSLLGIRKHDCENLIKDYKEKIDVIVARAGRIYGPLDNKKIKESAKINYMYISDFIEGLYQLSTGKYSGIYNISKEVDSSKLEEAVDWKCMISQSQGRKLIETYQLDTSKKPKRKRRKRRVLEKIISYVMTAIIFMFFLALENIIGNSISLGTVNFVLLYIVVISVVFGMTQGIAANILAIIYLLNTYTNQNRDMLTLLLDYRFISEILICMSIALLVGYFSDRRELKLKLVKKEADYLKDKYKFIEEISEDTFIEKVQLERQILNSENSIGNLYKIISGLDSLETQDILNNAINVLEEVLDNKTVSIYSAGKSGEYMRLEVSSHNELHCPEKSIKIKKNSKIYDKLINDNFYANKDFDEKLPAVIGAITEGENIQAIVVIDTLEFENMNLYYENIFKVTIKLITSAINRAMVYQKMINSEKYVENTNLLKEESFKKVLKIKLKSQEENHSSLSILEVDSESLSEDEVANILEKTLRETDYFGYMNGKIKVLLTNTDKIGVDIVKSRLNSKGIKIKELSEDEVCLSS